MRKAFFAIAALAALAIPAASFAQEAAAEAAPAAAPAAEGGGLHLKLGLGVGYGLPMGDVMKDVAMSDGVSGEIPIEVEASYGFTPSISAGIYAGYALGMPASDVKDSVDSISAIRVGVQGAYDFGKMGPADLAAAVRVGYVSETAKLKEVAGITLDDETMTGFELTLLGSYDFEVAKSFAVGPFVSVAIGQYTTAKAGGESASIEEKAMHEWLTIGLRGSFEL